MQAFNHCHLHANSQPLHNSVLKFQHTLYHANGKPLHKCKPPIIATFMPMNNHNSVLKFKHSLLHANGNHFTNANFQPLPPLCQLPTTPQFNLEIQAEPPACQWPTTSQKQAPNRCHLHANGQPLHNSVLKFRHGLMHASSQPLHKCKRPTIGSSWIDVAKSTRFKNSQPHGYPDSPAYLHHPQSPDVQLAFDNGPLHTLHHTLLRTAINNIANFVETPTVLSPASFILL